jgi:hypothetical protein
MTRLITTRIQQEAGGVDVVVAPGEAAIKIALLKTIHKHKQLIPLHRQHSLGEVEQNFVVGVFASTAFKQRITLAQSPRLSRMHQLLMQGVKLRGYCRGHMKIIHRIKIEAILHYLITLITPDPKGLISLDPSSHSLEKTQ